MTLKYIFLTLRLLSMYKGVFCFLFWHSDFSTEYITQQLFVVVLNLEALDIIGLRSGAPEDGDMRTGPPLVTQPIMQRRLNPMELRSMDSYIQILCRFQKCK